MRDRLDEDRRVFAPVERSSYVWQDYYDQRSALKRVNSRVAFGFGFERTGPPQPSVLYLKSLTSKCELCYRSSVPGGTEWRTITRDRFPIRRMNNCRNCGAG